MRRGLESRELSLELGHARPRLLAREEQSSARQFRACASASTESSRRLNVENLALPRTLRWLWSCVWGPRAVAVPMRAGDTGNA